MNSQLILFKLSRVLLGTFIFLNMSAAVPVTLPNAQPSPPPVPDNVKPDKVMVDLNKAKVGDVVAQGVVDAEGNCDIDQFEFQHEAPGDGETSWTAIDIVANCRMILAAKWKGLFKDGPKKIVNPEPGVELTASLDELQIEEVFQTASSGSKTSKQEVFMYGGGGQSDKLTKVTADVTFSWDGTRAWVASGGKNCWGSRAFWPDWWWAANYCGAVYSSGTPSDPTAWYLAEGDFSCYPSSVIPCSLSNPDGYYHTLANYMTGDKNGKASCTYWYSGQIVLGVTRKIISGCN